jgi:rare lipoprotein A
VRYLMGMRPGAKGRLSRLYGGGAFILLTSCAQKGELRPPREPVLATHANAKSEAAPAREQAPTNSKPDQVGEASWYGSAFAGRRTSSGEIFDPKLFTAAHKQLPFGTWVEVRRVDTGRTVRVRINDRGPNGRAKARIIDLSQRAAEDLDIVRLGVVQVELRIVDGP